MKVLFVGEGAHDIGPAETAPLEARPAVGVVPTLARKVCAEIDADSLAIQWTQIPRFNPTETKRGFAAKVRAAILLSETIFGCAGTVCVADQDGNPERRAELERGRAGRPLGHPVVCGLAVESIESWTLGAPDAIAAELGVKVADVKRHIPRGKPVESLKDSSQKASYRPKGILDRINNGRRHSDGEFRRAVAERTSVQDLERACPQGFGAFAKQLREEFCPNRPGRRSRSRSRRATD